MKRRLSWLVTALGLVFFTGCTQQYSENGSLAFSYQPWVVLVPLGIAAFTQKKRLWGVILIIAGPIVAIGLAPGLYLDKVVVSEDTLYSRHGFWWSPTIHNIRYDDLSNVRFGVDVTRGRRGRKNYNYYFDCSYKSGKQERVPVGDLVKPALDEIGTRFAKHGVNVVDTTGNVE
jgi:hypothetical protein